LSRQRRDLGVPAQARDQRQLSDPSFLDSIVPASLKITLGHGEQKTQDLRLGGGH
jgi:hypothetical protein